MGIKMKKLLFVILYLLLSVTTVSAAMQQLKVSPNGRHFVYEDNTVFFWMGDTAWSLLTVSTADIDLYLADRAAKGFNIIQVDADAYGAQNYNGLRPFGTGQTVPVCNETGCSNATSAWWSYLDTVIEKASDNNLYVALIVMWGAVYYDGDYFGGYKKMGTGTAAKTNAYWLGYWLGTRYKNKPNIVWTVAGEYTSVNEYSEPTTDQKEVMLMVANGIYDSGATQPMTIHSDGNSLSIFRDYYWHDFTMVQSGHSESPPYEPYTLVTTQYNITSPTIQPVINAEILYENVQTWATASAVRRKAYWSVFAGGFGVTYGQACVTVMANPYEDCGGGDWKTKLNATASTQMQYLRLLMESKPLSVCAPDQTVIISETSGYEVRALRASDGTYVMVYIPDGASVTVDMTKISSGVKAQWYDVQTGVYTLIGTYQNTGSQVFDAPGTTAEGNDWVLVLEKEQSVCNSGTWSNTGGGGYNEPVDWGTITFSNTVAGVQYPETIVKSVKSSGGDYASMQLCVAGQAADLVSNNTKVVCEAQSAFEDTTAVDITGYTTDENHYIELRANDAVRHQGMYSTGKYRLKVNGTNAITIQEGNVKINGLQIYNSSTSADISAIKVNTSDSTDSTNIYIEKNIIRADDADASGRTLLRFAQGFTGSEAFIRFNLLYGLGTGNSEKAITVSDGDFTVYADNNTIDGIYDTMSYSTASGGSLTIQPSSMDAYIVESNVDACAACPSDADGGDIACEDWEGSDICSWSTGTTDCVSTYPKDMAHSGTLSCDDKGSQALEIKYNTTDTDAECYKKLDASTTKTKGYLQFYLNLIDSNVSTGAIDLFYAVSASGGLLNLYASIQSDSTYKLKLDYYNTASSWSTLISTNTLNENQSYRIRIPYDTDTGNVSLKVDDTVNSGVGLSNARDPRYFYFGTTDAIGYTKAGADFQIENFKFDDDTEPPACAQETNTGSLEYFTINGLDGNKNRALVNFDFSSLDDLAVITNASLRLYYNNNFGTSPVGDTVYARRLTTTGWVESQATWNYYSTGNSWTAGGGDYTETNQTSMTVPSSYGWMYFDVTSQAQYAQSYAEILYSLIMKNEVDTVNEYVAFASSENTSVPSLRPTLVINYTLAGSEGTVIFRNNLITNGTTSTNAGATGSGYNCTDMNYDFTGSGNTKNASISYIKMGDYRLRYGSDCVQGGLNLSTILTAPYLDIRGKNIKRFTSPPRGAFGYIQRGLF
jgi:hypothetical protein